MLPLGVLELYLFLYKIGVKGSRQADRRTLYFLYVSLLLVPDPSTILKYALTAYYPHFMDCHDVKPDKTLYNTLTKFLIHNFQHRKFRFDK